MLCTEIELVHFFKIVNAVTMFSKGSVNENENDYNTNACTEK